MVRAGAGLVLFDMDGTLLDSAAGISDSLTCAIRQLGHDFVPGPAMHELFGPPMQRIVATLLAPYADSRVDACVAFYRAHYREQGLYNCRPYPGIDAALGALLEQGFVLHVATSKRQEFAERMLSHTGLARYFTSIQGTTADGALDDKMTLVETLLARVASGAAVGCLVGDKRDDMRAATANGLVAVGALWGYGANGELSDNGADVLVESPSELPRIIQALAAG